jgi:hypothetical protein
MSLVEQPARDPKDRLVGHPLASTFEEGSHPVMTTVSRLRSFPKRHSQPTTTH